MIATLPLIFRYMIDDSRYFDIVFIVSDSFSSLPLIEMSRLALNAH